MCLGEKRRKRNKAKKIIVITVVRPIHQISDCHDRGKTSHSPTPCHPRDRRPKDLIKYRLARGFFAFAHNDNALGGIDFSDLILIMHYRSKNATQNETQILRYIFNWNVFNFLILS